jgi:E3 ubiquitin-protein ligase SHPRH
LKVLIYDGWSKVTVPITETEAEEKREQLRSKGKSTTATKDESAGASKSATKRGSASASKPVTKRGSAAKGSKAKGRGKAKDKGVAESPEEVLDWCSYINTFDVCITTYNILRSDFNVARAPLVRPRREDVNYGNWHLIRSPLIMCEWYRVIMDEVQMVGGGNAA